MNPRIWRSGESDCPALDVGTLPTVAQGHRTQDASFAEMIGCRLACIGV